VRRELDIPFEGVTDDATFWVADLRGVRGLPDNSMAARFGDAMFAVAFPLGPAGHTRLVALAPREGIGQQEALAVVRDEKSCAAARCCRGTRKLGPLRWPAGCGSPAAGVFAVDRAAAGWVEGAQSW
jgi:hypothetical protein